MCASIVTDRAMTFCAALWPAAGECGLGFETVILLKVGSGRKRLMKQGSVIALRCKRIWSLARVKGAKTRGDHTGSMQLAGCRLHNANQEKPLDSDRLHAVDMWIACVRSVQDANRYCPVAFVGRVC